MARFKVGDTLQLQGRLAKVVWLSENANEIEAMDEYMLEFEDKQRKFIISGELLPKQSQPVQDRKNNGDPRQRQTY